MKKNVLSKKIDAYQSKDTQDKRDYIGASTIGSNCYRRIWYEYKGYLATQVPVKTRRTWDIGKKLESLILDWLELAGLTLDRNWPELQSTRVPFLRGHVDAVWIKKGKPFAIIEIKTAKNGSFRVLESKGVREWDPGYYAQIQTYMGMSGIYSAYVLALNKDSSELYDEVVTFDPDFYAKLEDKALLIGRSPVEPPKIHASPLWFECKMCKFNKVCHK